MICQLPSRCHLHSLIQEAACRACSGDTGAGRGGAGRGGQARWAWLPFPEPAVWREGDSTGSSDALVPEQHRPPRLAVASDWVSLSPPLPCPPAYVVERERKTEDAGCQAALAACWAALCCCCLLESLD